MYTFHCGPPQLSDLPLFVGGVLEGSGRTNPTANQITHKSGYTSFRAYLVLGLETGRGLCCMWLIKSTPKPRKYALIQLE